MGKLVSIVLPVYNGEKYLAQSIESVLNQSYKNIELIIVNDCSTDSSEEIILEYKKKDNRIKYFKNDINIKLPQSLNNGFAMAKGNYFTWTSDDNVYHQDAIETMVGFLDKHSKVGLVYCDFNIINESGEYQYKVIVGNQDEQIYKNIVGACFLYRRSIAENIGEYDTSFFLVEDYEYWLRINLEYSICPLHKCIYDYRTHDNSLSITRRKEIEQRLARLHWDYLAKYEKSNMNEQELFQYFDFILKYSYQKTERIKLSIKFFHRHKNYLFYSLRKRIKILRN